MGVAVGVEMGISGICYGVVGVVGVAGVERSDAKLSPGSISRKHMLCTCTFEVWAANLWVGYRSGVATLTWPW